MAVFLLLNIYNGFSQIKSTVTDSKTNEPVPYVNIWVENENIGATADENGNFTLPDTIPNSTIIVSAVGYSNLKLPIAEIKEKTLLEPQSILLNEVVITRNPTVHKRIINPIDKIKKLTGFMKNGEQPEMCARFIPYKAEYNSTPYINKITFLPTSHSKNIFFNVRLLKVNEDGTPGESLHNENILVKVKRKRKHKKVTANLSKLNIKIPTEGFFVVVEWLILDENRVPMYDTRDENGNRTEDFSKWKIIGYNYPPVFMYDQNGKQEETWWYKKGTWNNGYPLIAEKYYALAAEIELTD